METSHAIRLYATGGPQQLIWERVDVPAPGPGQVLVRHSAIGVNFSDVYLRTGLYGRPLPSGMGAEAAGVVEAVGRKVTGLREGDRVAYYFNEPGAYSERRVLPAEALLKIPAGVTEEQAAAVLLKGLTSWFLVKQTCRIKSGDVVLVQAAAGGVGLILTQWLRTLGATVYGVVGREEKVGLAKKGGCHKVLVGLDDLGARVRKLNKGRGVDVVYDGVGKDSLLPSLDCLRPRGMMVSFGNASGPAGPFSALELARRGSLYFTRPTAADYLTDVKARRKGVTELFGMIKRGQIKVLVGQRFALIDAAKAQGELEARRTVGCTILIP